MRNKNAEIKLPSNGSKPIAARVTFDLDHALRRAAKEEGTTLNQIINKFLINGISKREEIKNVP